MINNKGVFINELSSSTSLDNQISYIEKLNNLFRSPVGIAVLNSLKELKSIKNNEIPKKNDMNIEDENRAKNYYINSGVEGIHAPRTNMVELNYLDLLTLMDGYAKNILESQSNYEK